MTIMTKRVLRLQLHMYSSMTIILGMCYGQPKALNTLIMQLSVCDNNKACSELDDYTLKTLM